MKMFLKAFTERCTTSDLHLFKATYAKCSYDVTYTYSALRTVKTVATLTQTIPLLYATCTCALQIFLVLDIKPPC